MDGRLRQLLGRSQLPKGKIDWAEAELTAFFNADPDGVWLACLESSYDRLLTHAVAQWLGLKSESLPLDAGGKTAKRSTQVGLFT